MTTLLLVVVASYLVGAIPFSYVAGRALRGIDLRRHGSGNLGASNSFRILGARVALAVLVLDLLKGFFPVHFAGQFADGSGMSADTLAVAAMFAATCGHMFSPYVRFSGGKGIATSAGAFLALTPWACALSVAVFALVFATRRIVSLASLCASAALPLFVYASGRFGFGRWNWTLQIVSTLVMMVVVAKHRGNIRRLLAGTEPVLARKREPANG